MNSASLPVEGSCRCGRLRIRVSQPPVMTMACHCTGCQKMSASAFSLTAIIPEAGFEVLAGDPVIGGLHGQDAQHHHCDWCKSWVFTRSPHAAGFVNVRPTMLGVAEWCTPFVETFTSEGLGWAKTSAKHSYPAFPPMEAFGPLMAEYAATR
ncbi:GFA family protein [Sphingomonas soli]|uniref:GFA family protein n=1 Tax=Sphingomonas soli TaxID=266127 RepID=UPI0008295B4B|nr:GFA family protein [Sphingomonas soli]